MCARGGRAGVRGAGPEVSQFCHEGLPLSATAKLGCRDDRDVQPPCLITGSKQAQLAFGSSEHQYVILNESLECSNVHSVLGSFSNPETAWYPLVRRGSSTPAVDALCLGTN